MRDEEKREEEYMFMISPQDREGIMHRWNEM